MKINGLDAIGDETGCKGYMGKNAELLPERNVGPEFDRFWWKHIHSGSRAIEAAREILECPGVIHSGERTAEILFVCAELIFRVTGEQVTPNGFKWWGDGNLLDCGVCGFNFDDA